MNYNWPGSALNILSSISEATEGQKKPFSDDAGSEDHEEKEGQENAKEGIGDVSETTDIVEITIEPRTWEVFYPDGTSKKFMKKI